MPDPAALSDDARPRDHAESYGVVIADDDDDVRLALAELIDEHPLLHLVGEAMDGLGAAELCTRYRAHLALIDVRMPHGGVSAVAAIRSARPTTIVVAYTTLADRRTRSKLLEAGARAVFVKGGAYDLGEELAALVTP